MTDGSGKQLPESHSAPAQMATKYLVQVAVISPANETLTSGVNI